MRRMRRAHVTILLFLSSFLVVTLWMVGDGDNILTRVTAPLLYLGVVGNGTTRTGIECYFESKQNILDDISTVKPKKSDSIFFHETSCASSAANNVVLNARQACAVESAAKMNPASEVYLLFTSPVPTNSSDWPEVVRQLMTYDNVRVLHLDFERYVKGTPLEKWYHGGALKWSQWPMSHASDVLRFLTLWKYGGTYLDLDVVVTRSFQGMRNFAGAESALDVAAGVLNFAADGAGHEMATACIEDLRTEFRGNDWGNNGPGVITRVLKKTCRARLIRDMRPERCGGFKVMPPSAFYPIPWRQWKLYFDATLANATMARVSESYAVHVWNKFSLADTVTVGSRQPYGQIAAKFCPRVYGSSGTTF